MRNWIGALLLLAALANHAEAAPSGDLPAGLPARLTVGLFEDTGGTWMHGSGVKWDVRYRYVTKGWANNWGYGARDGGWAMGYLKECASAGYLPALQYYQLVAEPGGGEGETLAKVQNAATMKGYFDDFKLLMQRVKEFKKPVLVLLEADAFGFLEQQSGHQPGAYAAVKETGLPELAGLPDTVAGWGLAFLQLRKAVGASNAILGVHVSGWASGKDIGYVSVTDPLGPEVDKVYDFLAPAGLAANVTGQTYDVLVGDPLDRDSDFYRVTKNEKRWWDPADGAPVGSASFNRYAEWLRLFNRKAGKRWVLWQIPLGNSNHKNVENKGGPSEGYKDNRPEYFFGDGGAAHRSKFVEAGVVSLLFGAGAGGVSSYQNDLYKDGQPFMKTRAGAFLAAGGLAVPGKGPRGTGVPVASAGAPTYRYGFETSNDGWITDNPSITVAQSKEQAFAGTGALKVVFDKTPAGQPHARVKEPAAPAGALVTFRIWFPAGSPLTVIHPYVLQGASTNWAWTGSWREVGTLQPGKWNTIVVKVPPNATMPLAELGVELRTNAPWTGAVYIDGVNW
ncbi:MAG TPA: hypothetical protein VN914_10970 [Polyangia bacterium]|nr:hypothetical protein [Polyangia bacterium]